MAAESIEASERWDWIDILESANGIDWELLLLMRLEPVRDLEGLAMAKAIDMFWPLPDLQIAACPIPGTGAADPTGTGTVVVEAEERD